MTDNTLQVQSTRIEVSLRTAEQLGEDWIQAIIDQNFGQLIELCQQDIKSTLLLPRRIPQLESAIGLGKEVEDWFGEYDFIHVVQSRVGMVGEKLSIYYQLRCVASGGADLIEQQLYCTVRDGKIGQLRLICSGFQPDLESAGTFQAGEMYSAPTIPTSVMAAPQANARLDFRAESGQGSTCAMLTPLIKSKLVGMSSSQVLEVHVDDVTAKEDIEAWSRLSGNSLLKMDQTVDQELVFYIQKK